MAPIPEFRCVVDPPGFIISTNLKAIFLFDHCEAMPLLSGMGDITSLKSRARVYRQLRCRSDLVRTQLIPTAVADGTAADRIFHDMTKAYFEGDVRSGRLVGTADILKAGDAADTGEFHVPTMDELTAPRGHRCTVTGFETLHPRYLKGTSGNFFDAIDNGRARRRRGEFDPGFLTIVSFCLQLAHIAEDGTGRTAEDMLVLLAAESGRTLTISQTGYRGALEGTGHPVFYKLTAQKIFHFEVVANFYRFLGLAVPESMSFEISNIVSELGRIGISDGNNRLGWPDGLGPAIAGIYKEIADDPGPDGELFRPSHPYGIYAGFLACELIYLTLCMEDPSRYLPGLKLRYPAGINCDSHSLTSGLDRTYLPVAEGIGDICDEAVALIESVRLGLSDRDQSKLETAVKRIESEDAEIGRLFRRELSLFLTEDEKNAIQFAIPHAMTGDQLEKQIRDGIRKVRG